MIITRCNYRCSPALIDPWTYHFSNPKDPAMKKNTQMPEFKFCKTQKVIGFDAHWCRVTQANPGICEYSDDLNNELYFCQHPGRSNFES